MTLECYFDELESRAFSLSRHIKGNGVLNRSNQQVVKGQVLFLFFDVF